MRILSLDTSTKNFSLVVSQNKEIVAERNIIMDKILSTSIIPEIENILKRARTPLSKLDGFVVGLGPGSFTSLRVGLSTVKALAFATNKPVVGISSLDAVAINVHKSETKNICVISDAKRNLVYAAVYQRQGEHLKRQSKYLLTPLDGVLKEIKGTTIFTGDAVGLFREQIVKHKGMCEQEKYWPPRASYLLRLAWPRIQKRDFDDIHRLVPLYLYPKDCQVKQ